MHAVIKTEWEIMRKDGERESVCVRAGMGNVVRFYNFNIVKVML